MKLSIDELELYRIMIARAIAENDEYIIPNKSTEKARILIDELIKSSKSTIHIKCTQFAAEVYDYDVVESLRLAQARGCEVKIAIQNDASKIDEYRKVILALFDAKFNCGEASQQDFCVIDGKRYRLETDKATRTAKACACDVQTSQDLEAKFAMLMA